MPDTSTTLFFATLGALAVGARYYFRNYSTSNTGAIGTENNIHRNVTPRSRQVTQDMVAVVQVLVPQISAEEILKDLNVTHSVEQTTQNLLNKVNKRKKENTLFDRYNVDINTIDKNDTENEETDANWVQIREKREAKLRNQRVEMLLKARKRSMEIAQRIN